ncbi:M48 family metallopeptidase [Natronorarus salvus]|uniref:M48 family metallopeptidase n=1 Tax=Natronorarus salvus TaxID=3117733 RepID=UPI002F26C897
MILASVAWAVHALFTVSGTDLSAPLPLAVGLVLLGSLALVAVEARYGYRHTLRAVGSEPVEGDGPRNVAGRVRRLVAAADVPVPEVAIAERSEPTCFSVGDGTGATVVLTRGLLSELDDVGLDAVLAHEIAHLANRDTAIATVVATLSSLSGSLFARERRLGDWLVFLVAIGTYGGLAVVLVAGPLLLVLLAFAVVSVFARLALAANALWAGLHAQSAFAADRAAARLVGDPTALAAALETLAPRVPDEDLRAHASATLGIVLVPIEERSAESAQRSRRSPSSSPGPRTTRASAGSRRATSCSTGRSDASDGRSSGNLRPTRRSMSGSIGCSG